MRSWLVGLCTLDGRGGGRAGEGRSWNGLYCCIDDARAEWNGMSFRMTWRKWQEISLVAVRVWLVSVMNERLSQLLAEPLQLCRRSIRS